MAKNKKASAAAPQQAAPVPAQKLTAEQEVGALRAAHSFFSNFDRVPGSFANPWAQALDAIAIVANSLIAKQEAEAKKAAPAEPQAPAVQ